MPDNLLDLAIATTGGDDLWNGLRALKEERAIARPIARTACPAPGDGRARGAPIQA